MAGKKQHYIPRLFLRAFRSNPRGKVAQVRVYRRDRNYPANVDDVAAERFFYSELSTDGSETLDDIITRYEAGLTEDVARLRQSTGAPLDPSLAARVVTHLLIRNRHIRGFMRTGVAHMAGLIEEIFGGDEQVRALLGAGGPIPGPRFRELFAEHLGSNSLLAALALPEPVLLSLTYMMLRESAQAGFGEISQAVRGTTALMREQGDKALRDAHLRTLSESLAPSARVEVLETLEWTVEQATVTRFILPDFVALGLGDGDECASLLGIDRESLSAVMMPLAPGRMLVGRRAGRKVEVEAFNILAAPHCIDFFVTPAAGDEFDRLAAVIGDGVEAQIAGLLSEAAETFRFPTESAAKGDVGARPSMELPGSFQLHSDWLEPDQARRLGEVLAALVRMFQDRFDVSALARVHVNANYEAAMTSVDHGGLAEIGDAPLHEEAASTVAYNFQFEQDGELKVAMLLRPEIALGLLESDLAAFGPAAGVVLAQLARTGTAGLLEEVFAGGLTAGAIPDAILIQHAIPAWQSYFVHGYACLMDPARHVRALEAFASALGDLKNRLELIRRAYRDHGDVDRLLGESLPAVGEVLTLAASAATPVGGTPPPAMEALRTALEQLDHARWFDLLRADLASIWYEGNAYPSQEAFLVLNRHLERLLLSGAMFLWENGGQARVEVPFWSDWEWIASEVEKRSKAGPAT